MNPRILKKLLKDVREKKIDVDKAFLSLRTLPFLDLGFAKPDTHRAVRRGFPEIIYCRGKTVSQVKKIFRVLAQDRQNVIATRAGRDVYRAVKRDFKKARYYRDASIIALERMPVKKTGLVAVVTAGTSDIPVAEEARVTAELLGANTKSIYDAGVSGIHRLLAHTRTLQDASVIIAVAGMEGALPSVVAGLVARPVIAVPTSVGYGAGFYGTAALLAMLNSCAGGVLVVNIDNGFGAGYAAAMINGL